MLFRSRISFITTLNLIIFDKTAFNLLKVYFEIYIFKVFNKTYLFNKFGAKTKKKDSSNKP